MLIRRSRRPAASVFTTHRAGPGTTCERPGIGQAGAWSFAMGCRAARRFVRHTGQATSLNWRFCRTWHAHVIRAVRPRLRARCTSARRCPRCVDLPPQIGEADDAARPDWIRSPCRMETTAGFARRRLGCRFSSSAMSSRSGRDSSSGAAGTTVGASLWIVAAGRCDGDPPQPAYDRRGGDQPA